MIGPRVQATGLLLLAGLLLFGAPLQAAPAAELERLIADRLDRVPASDRAKRRELELTRTAYAARGFAPSWTDGRRAGAPVAELFELLESADVEGLDPRDHPTSGLRAALRRAEAAAPRSAAWLELDLALTRAAVRYGRQLAQGRLRPEEASVRWLLAHRDVDVAAAVTRAMETGRVSESIGSLAPRHPEYARLRLELTRLRAAARSGGWPLVPPAPAASAAEAAAPLREALARRLAAEDYLPEGVSSPGLVDSALRAFQEVHGLTPDGVLGPATRAALGRSPEERAQQVTLNMERWRWVPDRLGEPHVRVNLPAFELSVHEQGREVLTSRVIVGRSDWATPAFTDSLRRVMLNPYWNVPDPIARHELLPKIKRDPGLLNRRRYTVLDSWRTDATVVDPRRVNWKGLTATSFPYRLRQEPGGGNALGRLIFLLDNDFEIYLHDTPGKRLFERAERSLSHGCIRVEASRALAERLFAGEGRAAELRAGLATNRNAILQLDDAVPLHVLHFTATPGPGGRIRSLPDLYGVDAQLADALENRRRSGLPVR